MSFIVAVTRYFIGRKWPTCRKTQANLVVLALVMKCLANDALLMKRLLMKRLASLQHLQNHFHPLLLCFWLLGRLQPVSDCVTIRFVERVEKHFRLLVLTQAAKKSFGKVPVLGESYAAFQQPSFFAASIWVRPAVCMRPAFNSLSACCVLTLDQPLLERLGVNLCSQDASS